MQLTKLPLELLCNIIQFSPSASFALVNQEFNQAFRNYLDFVAMTIESYVEIDLKQYALAHSDFFTSIRQHLLSANANYVTSDVEGYVAFERIIVKAQNFFESKILNTEKMYKCDFCYRRLYFHKLIHLFLITEFRNIYHSLLLMCIPAWLCDFIDAPSLLCISASHRQIFDEIILCNNCLTTFLGNFREIANADTNILLYILNL